MAIFGNRGSKSSGIKAAVSQPQVQQLFKLNSVSLTSETAQQQVLDIQNYGGLPLNYLSFQLSITDTAGSTAPSAMTPLETAIEEFKLVGQSGTTILDLKGAEKDFEYWQHLLSSNGIYQSDTAPSAPAASGSATNTYNFVLNKYIPASEFPLIPTVILNNLDSRTTGSTDLSSSSLTLTVRGAFRAVGGTRTRLSNRNIPVSASGLYSEAGAKLSQGVPINRFAIEVSADDTLESSNTFNFSTAGQTYLNNFDYQDIINYEDAAFSISTPHIAGVFPLYTVPQFVANNTTNFSIDFASSPTTYSGYDGYRQYEIITY